MIKSLFRVRYNYVNPVEYQRAAGLLFLTWVFAAIYLLIYLGLALPDVLAGVQPEPAAFILFFGIPLLLFIIIRAIQSGEIRFASRIYVAITLVICAATIINQRTITSTSMLSLVVPFIAAGMLLDRRAFVTTMLMVLGLVVLGASGQSQLTSVQQFIPARQLSNDLIYVLVTLIVSGAMLFLFSSRTDSLVERILTRSKQLETAASFSTRVVQRSDEADLLQHAANDIHDRFDSYFVQIFVLDERKNLVRAARTGLGTIVSAQSDLMIDGPTAVSEAARMRSIVFITRNDDKLRRLHFLPATRSGLAIPVHHSEQLYGVIDLQKTEDDTLDSGMLVALGLVGQQLGAMLHQSRLVQDLRQSMQEQRSMLSRLQSQVAGVQRRTQLDSGTWDAYFKGRARDVLGFDLHAGDMLPFPANDIPSQLTPAVQSGELSVSVLGEEQVISIPISVRGQLIGAMSFSLPKDRPITERQRELVQTVSNRLSQALENVRLYEQSQIQAAREHKATEVSSVLVTATDVMTLLNTAAERFNEALGAVHTRIELQPGAEILDAVRVRSETS